MPSTKITSSSVAEIEAKLKTHFGDMVKIEFLENCLKQLLPNDAKRFCHLKLAELYAAKLMYSQAGRNMDLAAECATSYRDKIDFHLKEINHYIKSGDYFMIDKPFKKAKAYANDKEKEMIDSHLKLALMSHAEEFEGKNRRMNAAQVYERLMNMPIITETEKRMIIEKLGKLYSSAGKIKEAVLYEQMAKKPIEPKRRLDDDGREVRKVSFKDLGIERD